MARENVTTYFKKLLLGFIPEPDPLYAMMQWLTEQLMKIESEAKVGAAKNAHSKTRRTYFSGYRVRRFDTRLGTQLCSGVLAGWRASCVDIMLFIWFEKQEA